MSSRKRAHRDDKTLLKRRSTRQEARIGGQSMPPQAQQSTLVQRARQDPGSLSTNDVLQLQRLVGNQAVMRQLGRSASRPAAAIQRVKGVEERGIKHRRIIKSKELIKILSPKLKDDLSKHIFEAEPFNKAKDLKNPQGLHAYLTGGKLPNDVEEAGVEGSKGQVHKLTWKHKGEAKTKSSTMFPSWMPPDHVKTLIVLGYPDDTSMVVKEKIDLVNLDISKQDIKTYISHGQDIKLGKSGETVYPTR